jgi:NCS1 family nucleobase:cation symporter-1
MGVGRVYFFTARKADVSRLGSSNLASGLDLGGALGGIAVGGVLAGFVAYLCGEPGVRYHLGFSMMSRATFGMYGAWFVIMLKCFVNFIL